jgi:transcriptional regulator with XRE-family HTH domain
MSIGQNIHFYRKKKNLTLEELAKAIGTSKQTTQRYESGVIGNIPSDKIEKMAYALDCTPADLMGWTQKEEPANQDELEDKVNKLFKNLSPEKQEQVLNFLRFLQGQPYDK